MQKLEFIIMSVVIAAALASGCTEKAAEISGSTASHSEADDDGAIKDYEFEEMELVDDAISELIGSEAFQAAGKEERAEMSLALLNELAENGAGERRYPLIKKETIYYGGGDMITFMYSCGALGGIQIIPFDPMMN